MPAFLSPVSRMENPFTDPEDRAIYAVFEQMREESAREEQAVQERIKDLVSRGLLVVESLIG